MIPRKMPRPFRCRKVLLVNEFCVFASLADRGPFMPQRRLPIKRPPSRQRHFLYLSAWRVIVAQSADHICRTWSSHYNEERPHFSRDHLLPDFAAPPDEATTVRVSNVVCTTQLGGVIHSYLPPSSVKIAASKFTF